LDFEALRSVIVQHESRLSFIAAPTLPAEAETIRNETLGKALQLLKKHHEYVIADLPHDFHETTLQALDLSDLILLVASPDMASVRATIAALDTYQKLGYPLDRIRLILNATFPRLGLSHEKIADSACQAAGPDFKTGGRLRLPHQQTRSEKEAARELQRSLAARLSTLQGPETIKR
jgi:pilus assembly protein CpaE